MQIYNSIIYQKTKENLILTKLIGLINKFLIGIIFDFLNYEFIMMKLRYLNKSFLIFTQENCHFSMKIDRNAFIKVNLSEVYKGLSAMPMLSHPYYTNWTKLTIIYQICKGQDIEVEKIDKSELFMKELFGTLVCKKIAPMCKKNAPLCKKNAPPRFGVFKRSACFGLNLEFIWKWSLC